MAAIVDSIWAELAYGSSKSQLSMSWAVEVNPALLEGCDAEVALTWVGGQHSVFSSTASAHIGQVDWIDWQTDQPRTDHYPANPKASVTGGYWNKASRIVFGLATNSCWAACRIRVNLWA